MGVAQVLFCQAGLFWALRWAHVSVLYANSLVVYSVQLKGLRPVHGMAMVLCNAHEYKTMATLQDQPGNMTLT